MRRALLALVVLGACAAPTSKGIGLHAHPGNVRSSPAKVICDPLGTAVLDPIGNAMHLHLFFGNRDLFGGQGTSCGNPADTAHYWVPALVYRATGQPVPVQGFFAYYRAANGDNVGAGVPYPPGIKLVAGDSHNTAPLDVRDFNWSCDERSNRRGPYGDIIEAACNKAHGTVYLTAHIDFPSVNGSVTLRETVKWDYHGDGSDVALSSDLMMGAIAGRTLHGDFWNTWDQAGFEQFVHDCVNTRC